MGAGIQSGYDERNPHGVLFYHTHNRNKNRPVVTPPR
jgi:hypothetical protein